MNEEQKFFETISGQLNFYVYRLIDPRNDETFYVGKGYGNRLFQHTKFDYNKNDLESEKNRKITEIKASGNEVIYLVHRHGMDEKTALEVESSLIDAYPNTCNAIRGVGADEFGVMSISELIERYSRPEAKFRHKTLVVKINRIRKKTSSIYEAARYAWKVDIKRARGCEIVCASDKGLIVGVFVATEWKPATREFFPDQKTEFPNRWGFFGIEAPKSVSDNYIYHRIPKEMCKRGESNPVRYSS